MENQNGILRNPTAEEIEALRKKNQNTNVYKTTTPQQPAIENQSGVKLKPKSSVFEPDPVPYRLLTTNNVVKENLTANQEVFVRRTSGIEDAILSSFDGKSQEKILEGINQIIINCTKTETDVRQFPLTEKIPLFIFILSLSVGRKFNGAPIPDCNTCTSETVMELDIVEDFETNYMQPNDPNYPATIEVQSYPGAQINLSLEFPRIYSEGIFLKEVTNYTEHLDKILQVVKTAQGTMADGKKLTEKDVVDVVTYLNETDKDAIKQVVDNWTKSFGTVYKTTIKNCNNPSCCMRNKEVTFDTMDIIKNYITKVMTKGK